MDEPAVTFGQMVAAAKRFGRRLLTIGENRIELFSVELQEERERLFRALFLLVGMGTFGLLAAISFSGLIVVLIWPHSPVMAFLALTFLHLGGALVLFWRFKLLLRDWKSFSATIDQLKKDRECLERSME